MPEEPRISEDFDGLSTPRPESPLGTGPEPRPGRWCLLRHDLPDGSWHLDLMIERNGAEPGFDPARPLFTLRVPSGTQPRPHDPDCQGFLAERIGDHRAVYLDYEGPVSGDRGRVRRLASGTSGACRDLGLDGDEGLELALDGARYRSAGRGRQGLLRFERLP